MRAPEATSEKISIDPMNAIPMARIVTLALAPSFRRTPAAISRKAASGNAAISQAFSETTVRSIHQDLSLQGVRGVDLNGPPQTVNRNHNCQAYGCLSRCDRDDEESED